MPRRRRGALQTASPENPETEEVHAHRRWPNSFCQAALDRTHSFRLEGVAPSSRIARRGGSRPRVNWPSAHAGPERGGPCPWSPATNALARRMGDRSRCCRSSRAYRCVADAVSKRLFWREALAPGSCAPFLEPDFCVAFIRLNLSQNERILGFQRRESHKTSARKWTAHLSARWRCPPPPWTSRPRPRH